MHIAASTWLACDAWWLTDQEVGHGRVREQPAPQVACQEHEVEHVEAGNCHQVEDIMPEDHWWQPLENLHNRCRTHMAADTGY